MKVYCYLLNHARAIVKVGRTKDSASARMYHYSERYNIDILPNTLRSVGVTDDAKCESYVHNELVKQGYRNLKKRGTGAQELFQAPRTTTKKQAIDKVIELINKWESDCGVDVDIDDVTTTPTSADREHIDKILASIKTRSHTTAGKLDQLRKGNPVDDTVGPWVGPTPPPHKPTFTEGPVFGIAVISLFILFFAML